MNTYKKYDPAELKKRLTPLQYEVTCNEATEPPFKNAYWDHKEAGIYVDVISGEALFSSKDKYDSGSGWPSFTKPIEEAQIEYKADHQLGVQRTEVRSKSGQAHLGHVFQGEGFTPKDTRHCVNSISLELVKKEYDTKNSLSYAYFAGGCFWGVEYYLEKLKGVKEVISGFMGGHTKNPTYYDVVYSKTGHLEAVEVVYDKSEISYEELAKVFFEIHDPTQANGQGPDIGEQYISGVFVSNEEEKKIILGLISKLETNGYKIATKIFDKKEFYKAEEYHQDYYDKKGSIPYCHGYTKRF